MYIFKLLKWIETPISSYNLYCNFHNFLYIFPPQKMQNLRLNGNLLEKKLKHREEAINKE